MKNALNEATRLKMLLADCRGPSQYVLTNSVGELHRMLYEAHQRVSVLCDILAGNSR